MNTVNKKQTRTKAALRYAFRFVTHMIAITILPLLDVIARGSYKMLIISTFIFYSSEYTKAFQFCLAALITAVVYMTLRSLHRAP